MPKAQWGVSASQMREFDREKQFKPYTGPVPPNSVYQFKVAVLKHAPETNDKNPQLRIGLKLVPRNKDEKRFKDYWIMDFAPVTPNTQFRYIPFLDAIGVSEADFERRTIMDNEGNITKIGSWRMDGEQLILAQIRDGEDEKKRPRKEIAWYGALEEAEEYEDEEEEGDEEFDDDDEYDDDDDYDFDDED